MSLVHRAIYPSEVVLTEWRTVSDARTWANVEAEEWAPIATALGDPVLDSLLLVGAMPPHLLAAPSRTCDPQVTLRRPKGDSSRPLSAKTVGL